MFQQYVSNVALGTGTNYIIHRGKTHTIRVRACFRPELAGDFSWAFYFVNAVNSTFAKGDVAWRNRSGGEFTIESAWIAASRDASICEPESVQRLTFDGKASRAVKPDERFWSDPVRLEVPEGQYLMFDWQLTGDGFPSTPDSQAAVFIDSGDGFKTSGPAPLPAMLACDRPYRKRVAFLGDSITQGCGTRPNAYEMWAARIAAMLQPEYSVWNLGLGYARCDDAATDGCWLEKAKLADVVIATLGVNDLLHGGYKQGRPSSAGEVIAGIERVIDCLQSAGVTVILSTVPPFEFNEAQYREWRAVNLAIPRIAAMHGCRVYDIESALDATANLGNKFTHGAHPDGVGGELAAEKFRQTFHTDSGWIL